MSEKNKWISVKDRLPEDRSGKLMLCDRGHIMSGYYDSSDNEWVGLALSLFDMKVTHWTERPEPPKEELLNE